ncbi:MAG: protein translocase subunit SecD [Myxococcota bacterium]|nr:protein translocase subunit SecD [Myxococcota bacterium]
MSQQVKGRLFILIALIAFSSCALIPTYYKFTEGSRDALPAAFNNFFKNTLSLGLDLQGGIHIQYAVDTKEALRNKGRNFAARLMSELPEAEGMPESLKGRRVIARSRMQGRDAEEVTKIDISFPKGSDDKVLDPALTAQVAESIGPYLARFYPEYERLDVSETSLTVAMRRSAIASFKVDALEQAIEIIERRINAFGVAESSVSRRDDDKIVVELPGLSEDDFGAAKERLAQTGLLHFKIVEYDQAKRRDFFQRLIARAPSKSAWPAELEALKAHTLYTRGETVRSTSRELLEYLVQEEGIVDFEHQVGFERIFVNPQDPQLKAINNLSAAQEKALDQAGEFNPNDSIVKGYALRFLRIEGMTGENVEDAQVGYDEFNRPVTNMRFSSSDAAEFASLTEKNVNKNMAILIDDIVYSAPTINEPIRGGRVQISMGGGGNVFKEAQALAAVLKSGALQAPLRQLYSSQVGPTLGEESIRAGQTSIIWGFCFVVLFMIVYYIRGGWGFIANVALFLNLLFIAAGLATFGATLTLPGIAGIVLTVGMAVDANVLIFERIKEELDKGIELRRAINAGYEKAWSAILDANVTTGIAAIVLYEFGTGPIKGFAVTLGLGIISSMYTAIVITRLIFELTSGLRKA